MVVKLAKKPLLTRIVHRGSIRGICYCIFYSLLFLFGLSACQPKDSSQAIFDNYLYRLSNSLETDTPQALEPASLPGYPGLRDLRYSIPATKINLLDFLRLSQCDLQRHIGQKNSSLGKLMPATQQLIYDIQFVDLASECLSVLDATHELYTTLNAATEHKKQYLSYVLWNASFASEEFKQLFSLGTSTLSLGELKQKSQQLDNALAMLQASYDSLIEQDGQRSIDDIEDYYQVIGSSKRIGQLRLSMKEVMAYFARADQMLDQRIDRRALCINGAANSQYRIVKTVFLKFYVGEIQPYIANLHQQTQSLFLLIDNLLAAQQAHKDFEVFWDKVYRQDESEWQQFNRAVKNHTLRWQALFRQCGGLPGA